MHLSEDEETESSINSRSTRKNKEEDFDEHARISLLRIAKAIDGVAHSSNNEKTGDLGAGHKSSPRTRKEDVFASDFFSSQSTPIAQKNAPPVNKDRILTPIHERKNNPKLNTDGGSFVNLGGIRGLTYEDLESAKRVIDVLLNDKDLGNPRKEIPDAPVHNGEPEFLVVPRKPTEESNPFKLNSRESQNKDFENRNENFGLGNLSKQRNDYGSLSNSPQLSNLEGREEDKDEIESFKDSPLTSPPQSREILDSKNLVTPSHNNDASSSMTPFSRGVEDCDQVCASEKEVHSEPVAAKDSSLHEQTQLQKESINLESKVNNLESEVEQLRSVAESNASSLNEKVNSSVKREDLEDSILPHESSGTPVASSHDYHLELENLRQLTQAQDGEIRALRALRANQVELEEAITRSRINDLTLQLNHLNMQIGDTHALITKKNIPMKFHEYYDRFALDKVDTLSKTEMSNLIKNIMLSLLITDFNHLPEVSSKVGKFIRFLCLFMDRMHSNFFDDAHYTTRPSTYLRDYRYNIDDLGSCLDILYNKVEKYLELSG